MGSGVSGLLGVGRQAATALVLRSSSCFFVGTCQESPAGQKTQKEAVPLRIWMGPVSVRKLKETCTQTHCSEIKASRVSFAASHPLNSLVKVSLQTEMTCEKALCRFLDVRMMQIAHPISAAAMELKLL